MITLNWNLLKRYILLHLRNIAILTLVAALLGIVVSHPAIIKPKYKSRVVFYPSNIAPYSKESETEQALQLMEFSAIKDSIIAQFNLYEHYKIAPNQEASNFYMNGVYSENIRVAKTGYEAVEIIVVDEDPVLAYNIANAIIVLYNKNVKKLHEEKANEVAALYLVQIKQQQKCIDSLANKNQLLRTKYGVLNYEIQVEQATKGAFTGTHSQQAQQLLANLALYGNESQNLTMLLDDLRIENGKNVAAYFDALKEHNNTFTFTNIIVKPIIADKKHYPVRWLIVLSLALSTFILSCAGAIIIEAKK